MFDSHNIQTIFKAAGLSMSVKETQRAGQATEMVQGLDLGQCDALITVGGDGTVFEALQVISPVPKLATMVRVYTLTTTKTYMMANVKCTHCTCLT